MLKIIGLGALLQSCYLVLDISKLGNNYKQSNKILKDTLATLFIFDTSDEYSIFGGKENAINNFKLGLNLIANFDKTITNNKDKKLIMYYMLSLLKLSKYFMKQAKSSNKMFTDMRTDLKRCYQNNQSYFDQAEKVEFDVWNTGIFKDCNDIYLKYVSNLSYKIIVYSEKAQAFKNQNCRAMIRTALLSGLRMALFLNNIHSILGRLKLQFGFISNNDRLQAIELLKKC